MPWGVKCKVELRVEFVGRARREKNFSKLCREYGISRPTGYLWVRRFESSGKISSLVDRSHCAEQCPHQTPELIEKRVVELRDEYGWGADKLKVLLKDRHNIELPRVTINRIIARKGLLIAEECHRPALKRFERDKPNELWQVDLKGGVGRGDARCEPLSILDDCTRFVVGLHPVRTSQLEPIQTAMRKTFDLYGVPEAMLMDHGVPWWGTAAVYGLTKLSVWLMRQDIRLCFSGYNHPQTQGKVERFHRTLAQAIRHHGAPLTYSGWDPLLTRIQKDYNEIRPHEALDMKTPLSCYKPSRKTFNPKPKEFDYPAESILTKVGAQGLFKFRKRRLFASQSLVGETVRLLELENSLVVYFRNTILREIDLTTSKSSQWNFSP